MQRQSEAKDTQAKKSRRGRDIYQLLGALGERLYLEAMSLCDTEQEAAAWASANLVRSLEERRLLARLATVR